MKSERSNLHTRNSYIDHMRLWLTCVRFARHIGQEPKDARDHNAEHESPLAVFFIIVQTHYGGDLTAGDQDGEHGDDGQEIVAVDKVHGHAVDRVQRALDHDRVQGGGDGRGDESENDEQASVTI